MVWLPSFAVSEPLRCMMRIRGRGDVEDESPANNGGVHRVGRFEYEGTFPAAHVTVLEQLEAHLTDQLLRQVRAAIQQRRSDGAPSVSLRTLDWLVTNYSKKELMTCVGVDGQRRDLYNTYRGALDFYGRPLFDPFRRGPKVKFTLDGVEQETTIGQLNFFRFMVHSGVLDCALANSTAIEQDMIATQAQAKEVRATMGAKRRRVELTPSNPSRIHVVRLTDRIPPAVQ